MISFPVLLGLLIPGGLLFLILWASYRRDHV